MNGRQMNNFFLFTKSNTLLTQHSLSISLTTPNLRMTKFSTQTTDRHKIKRKSINLIQSAPTRRRTDFLISSKLLSPKPNKTKEVLNSEKEFWVGK